MKVILIHGNDNEKSSLRLKKLVDEAKRRNWRISRLDKQKKDILDELSSEELFSQERIFLIEDLPLLTKRVVTWIDKNRKRSGNILIYSNKIISSEGLKSLPKIDKKEEFKIPFVVFEFLESFYPKNVKKAISTLHKALKNSPPELILAMLAKHLKHLYIAQNSPEALDFPTWRKRKVIQQSSKFKSGKLEEVIEKLSEIDYLSKTSDFELSDLLDFLIATYLE